ncbi:39S ribosomal protein L51, mitochondrial [Lithohypha guttulata]|uniref:Large ribosomal subunit protein mL43 n=1 Tax=Lithohypha guttulata TaxID=1690604 RepID=A0AAN7SWP8_9EURO|nr:39S ribosomal protein L51, mitochondrial [Lithohypha guttulata]KAK5083631.1 39S ribosomal protein L51, mitochondrial [Lithohypha guttulata]KAK5103030.1 39S ribosomal protein L51, mitochondrial [Lithohypha guttulata]
MPVEALKTVATARNGVGAFILQCKRLDFHYCDWAGSSRGMNNFLASSTQPNKTSALLSLTSRYPSTEFRISPRPNKHPILKAYYINGNSKAVCVRNLEPAQIVQKAELLLQNSGTKNKKIRGRNVLSSNENVRGMWSALHGGITQI